MPIIIGRSKPIFEKNVKTEVDSGRDPKQALAIAYDAKRRAMRKHMNKGGMVSAPLQSALDQLNDVHAKMMDEIHKQTEEPKSDYNPKLEASAGKMAHGGYPVEHDKKYGYGGLIGGDDFLSDDMDEKPQLDELESRHLPDPDNTEHEIGEPDEMPMDPKEKMKSTAKSILTKIRMRHMGMK